MSFPVATIILPTFNHGATIKIAVQCALAQTVPVEIFIIGDGVSESNRHMILELVNQHEQLRFFDHPKHHRRGEPYRHIALREARGHIICYLCDRDIWLPDHVERMSRLLENADFAHSLPLHVLPGGEIKFFPVDLTLPQWRHYVLVADNRVPFSCAAHTLAFYKKLRGWEETPAMLPTDWHMFRQFFEHAECRCVSATYPSAVTFPSLPRIDWAEAQRIAELTVWFEKLASPHAQHLLVVDLLERYVKFSGRELAEGSEKEIELRYILSDIFKSPLWRFFQKINNIGFKILNRFGYRF